MRSQPPSLHQRLREANRRLLLATLLTNAEPKSSGDVRMLRAHTTERSNAVQAVRSPLQQRVTEVTASSRTVPEWETRSGFPEVRGGKAHARRECNSKYDMERDHLRRCQYIRYVRVENSRGQDHMHNHRCGGDQDSGCSKPPSTHSADDSCEKQPPHETQPHLCEHAHNSHYWMKTPDAVRSVTKKETCDGVEGARGGALLNAKAEERARGGGRGECPRQDALRASALLEVTGAHGTKETTRRNALKPRAAGIEVPLTRLTIAEMRRLSRVLTSKLTQ